MVPLKMLAFDPPLWLESKVVPAGDDKLISRFPLSGCAMEAPTITCPKKDVGRIDDKSKGLDALELGKMGRLRFSGLRAIPTEKSLI